MRFPHIEPAIPRYRVSFEFQVSDFRTIRMWVRRAGTVKLETSSLCRKSGILVESGGTVAVIPEAIKTKSGSLGPFSGKILARSAESEAYLPWLKSLTPVRNISSVSYSVLSRLS